MANDAALGWVFFDLGNTLVDESRSDRAYLPQLYDLLRGFGANLPKAQFHETAEGMMARRVASTHRQLAETLFLRYVGDRVDFDIAPAKALGMTTVLVKREYISSRFEPLQEEEKADFEIDDLRGLEDIVDHRVVALDDGEGAAAIISHEDEI